MTIAPFLLALFCSLTTQADPNIYVGKWISPENGSEIRFETIEKSVVGSTEVNYLDPFGNPNGEKIEYFFSYDHETNPTKIVGKLQTFDSHYNCFFENGPSSLEKMADNKLKVIFNRIVFTVKEYYNQDRWEKIPRYCYSDYYYRYRYLCGYDWREVPRTPIRRECVIKERIPTTAILNKLEPVLNLPAQ